MVRLTVGIPAGTRKRLVEHYGQAVRAWLLAIEDSIKATAAKNDITIDGFHDAGWTSVVAIGRYASDKPVILKALPDLDRYYRERAALAHWAGNGTCHLLGSDDTTGILLIELVGGAAGGAPRPSDDIEQIADALPRLHRVDVDSASMVPTLRDYYRRSLLPRIEKRASRFGAVIGEHTVRRAIELGAELSATPHRRAMLHSDLYAENVLFDADETPVFIDPDPKVGSPAFDWAFWCVYYRQDGDFAARVAVCRARVPKLADEVLAWALTLAVDGALYYLENDDGNATAMRQILASPALASVGP